MKGDICMTCEEKIEGNLMNNFMDRKEMVILMLESLSSDYENVIADKLTLALYGQEDKPIFNEKDYFDFISYNYLFYIQEKNEHNKKKFLREANRYLRTFPNIEAILNFKTNGKDFKETWPCKA
jgi:hypothetical protein